MLIRRFIVTVLLITMNIQICAQQDNPGISLEEYLEYLVGIGFSEYQAENFSEEIASLEFRPVDINSGSEEEISRLFFLSSYQVKSIINYINTNGRLRSVFELVYIPGFDKALARLCSGYISIDDPSVSSPGSISTRITSAFIYSNRDTSEYPGSHLKFSTRLSHQAGNISLGLCVDKDRGEKFLNDEYKPEFISGHVKLAFASGHGSLLIGDYRVRFGQGLLVWHGYSPGISPVNPNLMRGSSRIVPYLSSDENNFFRGLAYSLKRSDMAYNIYISANRIDATTEQAPDSSILVRSLYESGIHNSPTGLAKKDVLTEYSAGMNINYNARLLNLGWSLTGTMFSHDFSPYDLTENIMDFRGSKNMATSVDYALSLKRVYLYGEAALTAMGKAGFVQGLRLIPVERLKLNLLFGYTGRGYNSFHGHVFGKETINNFRKSLLANLEMDLAPGLTLYAGMISQSELWYGYRSASFPWSVRYMAQAVWQPREDINIKLSYKSRSSLEDIGLEQGADISEVRTLSSARLHLDLIPIEGLKLVSRVELSYLAETGDMGFMAFQGLRIDMDKIPLSLITRFYTYSTDNYDTRIYAWEDGLLFNPSVPAFYGRGSRTYMVIDYHPARLISLRFKFGIRDFVKEDTEISYNEYSLQLRLNLRGRKS